MLSRLHTKMGAYKKILKTEFWEVDKKIEKEKSRAEMKMVKRMSGVIRENKIRNKCIRSIM